MPERTVSGSVIERALVGRELPVALYAASVPLDEIGGNSRPDEDDADGFKRLVGETLALPSNVLLDEEQYNKVAVRVLGGDQLGAWYRYAPLGKDWAIAWEAREREVRAQVELKERPLQMFAEHAIALMVSGHPATFPYLLSVPAPPDDLRRTLDLETDETAFTTGLACLAARLQRSRRAAEFTETVLEYELPFGNSPRTSSDSLLKLLDAGRKMCLAPLGAGGTVGVTQLLQGQYIAAILSVGTGSVMTLILLGSVAVGSLLVSRLARRGDDGRGTTGVERGRGRLAGA
ncbi:MAG TPA: hypothetical protein VEM13_04505 [Gemmatimonadales bacterium]|nr:hypothetical protein [Gemmatimonadales bacterium]